MLKVAVIGAGTMATTHTSAYRLMDDVELVGIVDVRETFAEKLASSLGVRVYPSLEALLAQTAVDVVDICVPTYLHHEYVLRAAKAKKHIICEKPLARSLEQAREMIEVCEQENVRLFVGHVVRFFPEYANARNVIQAGEIGEVGTVRTMRGGSFPNATGDWYANLEKSGGLILDLIIHDFDYLRWTFGEVERVYAKALTGKELNRTDHAFVSLRFKNGVIANVEGSWAEPSGFHTEFEFAGSKGLLSHDSRTEMPIHLSLRAEGEAKSGVNVPESPLNHSPYFLELQHFLHCIETGQESIVTARDAYKALEISFAAIEAMRTGEPVFLNKEES